MDHDLLDQHGDDAPTRQWRRQRRTGLAGDLNHEWGVLRSGGSLEAGMRRWRDLDPALAGLCGVADLEAALGRRDNDDVLRALMRLCRSGDAVAARVLLQGLLGIAVGLARRTTHHVGGDREEAEARAVLELLDLLHTVPLTSRCRIADRIALDLLRRLTREARRGGTEVSTGAAQDVEDVAVAHHGARGQSDDAHGSPDRADLLVLHVLAAGARAGTIRADEARLLWEVHSPAGPDPVAGMAAAHGLAPAAVRQRVSRARRRLVGAAAA